MAKKIIHTRGHNDCFKQIEVACEECGAKYLHDHAERAWYKGESELGYTGYNDDHFVFNINGEEVKVPRSKVGIELLPVFGYGEARTLLCPKHYDEYVRRRERLDQDYPDSDVPPAWFDPADAGEQWNPDPW